MKIRAPVIKSKLVKENEKRTLGNWSARTWVLKVEFIIIIIIRNELLEIELREYRFLIIIIIIIIRFIESLN